MNNIDILEEKEKKAINKIDYIQDFIIENGQYNTDIDDMEYFSTLLNLISNLISENKELKEENKKLNIIRLEMLLSQFPDSTETYKKYKKELQSLLGKEEANGKRANKS